MVKQVKVLLLDFSETSDLALNLQEILESSPSPQEIQIRMESLKTGEPYLLNSDLSRITSKLAPDVFFLILASSQINDAGALFQSIKEEHPKRPVIVVTDGGEPGSMLELIRLGADDFITPPFRPIDVLPRVWRLLEQIERQEKLSSAIKEKLGLKHLLGESPAFLAEMKKVPLLSKCDARVLISGETGTGKELFARAIHYLSPRASKPFIPVNCGAIPSELVENELFGHERGAFTGATSSQPGLICEANGGTLFLDEVDCIPILVQVKLLRFLQEREYRPLGSTKIRKADVRVIAATNIDLEGAVRGGRFRRDLYYRLSIIPLKLPPLRERREDIPILAQHFLNEYTKQFRKQMMTFSTDALQRLMLYDWPGNVRELEHVVERAVLLSEDKLIRDVDILLPESEPATGAESFQVLKEKFVARFEKNYIKSLLCTYQGNITKAAEAARKNRRAFWQLIRKHQINVKHFKPRIP